MPAEPIPGAKTPAEPSKLDLAFWSPSATTEQIERFLTGARTAKVRAVCVPSGWVTLAAARLEETDIKIVALTGFPLGNTDADAKRYEAESAIDNGAHEIELVLNLGRIRENDTRGLLREIRDVVESADERPVLVALETGGLSPEQLTACCELLSDSGAAGMATSTGFWPGTTTSEGTVRLLRSKLAPKTILKATPISSEAQARVLLTAGATRLGTVVEPG